MLSTGKQPLSHRTLHAPLLRTAAHLIIYFPLLWVPQHIVRLVDLLKLVRVAACNTRVLLTSRPQTGGSSRVQVTCRH